uniref:RNase H type-1 domain-containing protein n=2 Tax=Parascaris univalens TaxID=6257 RepID=A0A915A1R5_PARUN
MTCRIRQTTKGIVVPLDGSCSRRKSCSEGRVQPREEQRSLRKRKAGKVKRRQLHVEYPAIRRCQAVSPDVLRPLLRPMALSHHLGKQLFNEAVILRTDFLPLVSAMRSSGYCGRFHDDYAILKEEAKRFPKGVEFEHVFGHEGEPGNEAANELARLATAPARATRSYSVPPSCRFRTQDTSRRRSQRRSRSRSTNGRPRSRVRSRNIHNNVDRTGKSRHHCRSSSAFVPGHKSRK